MAQAAPKPPQPQSKTVEAFYVTLILGRRRSLIAGPYPTRKGARRILAQVRTMIQNTPYGSEFFALQIARWEGTRAQAPVGRFNAAGLLPKGRIRPC